MKVRIVRTWQKRIAFGQRNNRSACCIVLCRFVLYCIAFYLHFKLYIVIHHYKGIFLKEMQYRCLLYLFFT